MGRRSTLGKKMFATHPSRRAIQKSADNRPVTAHTQEMLAFSTKVRVVKAGGVVNPLPSQQLIDPFNGLYAEGVALVPPLPPEKMLQLLEENAIHSACVEVKSTDSVGRGWMWESTTKGQVIPDKQIEELNQILEDITPGYSFAELLMQAAYEQLGVGWGAWEFVRDEQGRISAVYPMPAQTVRATPNAKVMVQLRGGRIRYFAAFGSKLDIGQETGKRRAKGSTEARAAEVLVFKTYSARSIYYGVPKWISAIPTIAELTAIREFNVSWFSSGGQSDRSIHVTATDQGVADKIADEMEEQLKANAGVGHSTVITAGTKDTDVAVEHLDNQTKEGHFRLRRGDLVKELVIGHQVPPYRIGWVETGQLGGGSGAAPAMLDAYRYGTVRPLQRIFEDRLNRTLFGPNGLNLQGVRFKFVDLDLDELKTEIDLVTKGVMSAVMTPNQGRKRLGQDEDTTNPALNQYYISQQLLPVEMAGQNQVAQQKTPTDRPATADGGRLMAPGLPEPSRKEIELSVLETFGEILRTALEPSPTRKDDT